MRVADFRTARLLLRNLAPAAARGPYARWMNDPEVTRYLESRFNAHDADSLADYVERINASRDSVLFGIFLPEEDRHIGNVKLGPVDAHHARVDLGILIGDKDCWGCGYASEVVRGASDWAFERLGVRKVTAGCYAPNEGCRRAFLRAGFVEEGRRPAHYAFEGRFVDGVLLGRLGGER